MRAWTVRMRKFLLMLAGAAAAVAGGAGIFPREPGADWGIKIESLRVSAGGYMLDFRYRVLDSAKAAPLVDNSIRPYLVHHASGVKLMVPAPGKVGPLRSSVRNGLPDENRVYFILFGNPAMLVKPGDEVSVVVGEVKLNSLKVT